MRKGGGKEREREAERVGGNGGRREEKWGVGERMQGKEIRGAERREEERAGSE